MIFVLFPIVYASVLSMTETNIFTGETAFVSFKNYVGIFQDKRMLQVLTNTIWYTTFATIGNTLLGLMLAVAVNSLRTGVSIVFRSVYFFPSLIGLVFVSIIWQYLFQQDTGIVNYYLGVFGIEKIGWLSDHNISKISVLIVDVWKNSGLSMLLILAGLQNIDSSYYEAGEIDGAGKLTKFFKITLPLVSPTLFFVIIMNLTGALRIFESIIVLTNGGPGDSSRSLVMMIWEKGFQSYNYGVATALSMLMLLFVALVVIIQFIGSKKWVHYD